MDERTRQTLPGGPVRLEDVLITRMLDVRPARPPDHEALNEALLSLAREIANSPRDILQRLVETAVTLCRAHSAGVSLLEREGQREIFRWHAAAGPFLRNVGGVMPREASACGIVVERDQVLLFSYPERRFPHEACVDLPIVEALLAPFHCEGRTAGTVWVLMHDDSRMFDAEDARVLRSLAEIAAAAYQLLSTLGALRQARDELEKTARALHETNRRKDRFLATLAHELRNPLAPILTALPLLGAEGAASPRQRRSAEIVQRQVRLMARLVDDLLDLGRITHDRLELRKERVALRAVVESALETSRPAITAGALDLRTSLPAAAVRLDVDPARLAQVLSNLLNNAAKYTPPGGHVELTARREGAEVVVSVSDDGMGISAEMLPRIFDMFAQESRVKEGSRGGLGIGLSLARRLVELHGGSLTAHSAGPGMGSLFVVRIPLPEGQEAPAEDGDAAGSSAATVAPAAAGGGALRILVVDDNEDAADALEILLDLLGHEVRKAHDGAQAVSLAGALRPDVVLLDIGLPRLDGYEAARRIRALPEGDRPLLVAMTGWGQEEDRRRAHDAGFDLHMVKPVDPAALEEVLSERARGPVSSRP